MNGPVKTIGHIPQVVPPDPATAHHRALVLMRQMEKLNPNPKPRGFIFKARTWNDYEAWRARQKNPRLW